MGNINYWVDAIASSAGSKGLIIFRQNAIDFKNRVYMEEIIDLLYEKEVFSSPD